MKKETKTIEVFCDVCEKKCDQDNRFLRRLLFSTNDVSNRIDVRISFSGDYHTNDGDVCNDCAIEALENILKQLRRE